MSRCALARRARFALPVLAAVAAVAWAKGPTEVLISLAEDGSEVTEGCYDGSVPDNGKFVLFGADAADLDGEGPGGTVNEVWLRDVRKGTNRLISVGADGSAADDDSWWANISGNGRVALFDSDAENLGPSDANGETDVYAVDLRKGTVTLVSGSLTGGAGDGKSSVAECIPISKNGRYIVFRSDAEDLVADDDNGLSDVFLHDLRTGETRRISVSTSGAQANGESWYPSISSNGRFVTFVSDATNLVDTDTNDGWDVFLHDVRHGTTTLVSIAADGSQGDDDSDYGSAVSNNGRYVAFDSTSTNLVEGDTNDAADIFLRDMKKGTVSRVSVRNDGGEVSGNSWDPSLSSNGKVITYWSYDDTIVPGPDLEWDQYVYDVKKKVTRRALTGMNGEDANGSMYWYRNGISPNGKWAAGSSHATNHVEGDSDTDYDVILLRVR